MIPFHLSESRVERATRIAFSYYVTSGLSAAVGLFVISGCMRLWFGTFAAATASIGVIVVVPPDQPAPRRGKYWQMLPSVCVGVPLFYAVRKLDADPLQLGLLLVPATFLVFLGAAWGRRGLPASVSAMFAIVFSMAVPAHAGNALTITGYFAIGAVAYLLFATAANALLNPRYRVQMLADTLLSMASLMRIQAAQFASRSRTNDRTGSPIGRLLREQAALADQLQSARDILLESPRTPRRQQLAGMLMRMLEMRDQLLACELDVDLLIVDSRHDALLAELRRVLHDHAEAVEKLADSLLIGTRPPPRSSQRHLLEDLPWDDVAPDMLARGLASRVGTLSDEISRLYALARGDARPELAVVRASWQMFISPASWSWQPFKGLWRWDAPPLRHAIRAALAIATAYGISLALPWGTHAYWILLTIVVVLRGSLAQTIERRNSRVAGTLLGSAAAGVLLAMHAPVIVLMILVTLAQGVAHAFAIKRYLVTAVAATVLALVQAHLLNADSSAAFEAAERIADTLLGVGVAWAFSYVLPAWERTQIPALIARALQAQARHAQLSVELGRPTAENRPELQWRLARREAYDSLSALVQATQRCLVEPRAVRPPLEPLGHLLAHGYQLLAQLTAVKTLLLLRRSHLDAQQLSAPLQSAGLQIESLLTGGAPAGALEVLQGVSSSEPLKLPDPFGQDVTPWLLRRLHLAIELARIMADDARRAEMPLASASSIRQDER